MTTTTNLAIPLVDAFQAQKEVTINEALTRLDAMISSSVADKDLTSPPSSPVAGVVYIVGPSPTGAWTGHENALTYYNQLWHFITPQEGMRVWVRDEEQYYEFDGSDWVFYNSTATQAAAFSPLLGNQLRMWLNFNDYASLSFTSGAISGVADKSGTHSNGAQVGASRPNWSSTGLNSVAPGAGFNAGNLVVTDNSFIQNVFSGGAQMVCCFTVTGDSSGGVLFIKSTDGAVASGYMLSHYGTGSYKLRFTVGASTTTGIYEVGPLQYRVPYVMDLSYSTSALGTAPVIYLNGVKQTVTTVATAAGTPGTDVGANMIIGNAVDAGTNNFIGQMGQLAIYNNVNTSDFMTTLRSYMGALSGIPTVPVYALCGQSNMVGNAVCDTNGYRYDPELPYGIVPKIWDGNRFAPLAPGSNNLGTTASNFGPEMTFAAMQSALLGQPAYLIKYALGATNLATNWAPTSGAQWIAMRAAFDAALPYLANSGNIPLINAFCWTQGETDGQNSTNAGNYQTNLTNFISAVATTAFANYVLSPDYRFVISGLPNQTLATIPYVATVTAAQQAVGALAGNAYIDTKDLTMIGDQVHLDAAGATELGKRFAATVSHDYMHYLRNFSIGTISTITVTGTGTGDVAGATSATDNAIARFDGTTGKAIQNSSVVIDDTGNLATTGTIGSGDHIVTSSTGTSLVVGPNGTTNPVLRINSSVASQATGLLITGNAAGSGTAITTLSSGTNENLFIYSKGAANLYLDTNSTGGAVLMRNNGTSVWTAAQSRLTGAVGASSTASTVRFGYTGAADTALTASTEAPGTYFNMGQTRQHATGALTLQRDFRITGSTHSAVAASTITDAAAFSIDGACIAGTNATITNSHAVYIPGSAVTSGVTNSYGLTVVANTGATNNYAAKLSGVVIFSGATPGISAGAGAGTSPTIAIAGSNKGGTITLTTGTTPTASAVIATITYSAPAPVGSCVVLTPGNAATAALSGSSAVFATGSTTTFTFTAGSAALAASTAYIWHYQVVQY